MEPRKNLTRNPFIEGRLLLGLASLAAILLAFTWVADAALEGEWRSLDERILLALRNPADPAQPLGPLWLREVMRDITGLGGHAVLTLVTAAVAIFLGLTERGRTAWLLVAAVAVGALASSGLKLFFARPRPDLVPHAVAVYTNSFPSGHALLSAIVYLTLAALVAQSTPKRRVKAFILGVAVILTLIIGVSRVYLGVHWPTDILAGWLIGAGWALLSWLVMVRLQRGGTVEVEPESG